MPNLQELPLPLAIIVFSYWLINRNNDEYAKKLIELIAQFTEKYIALYNRATEEREEARQRWLERDRQLIATLVGVEKALLENAKENHALRSTWQPVVLWYQAQARATRGTGKPSRGDDANATE